jgi:hypothetical protein
MTPASLVPDDVIEAIVDDRPVEPSYAHLATFAREVRALGDGPAPVPSGELAVLLRRGPTTAESGLEAPDPTVRPIRPVGPRRRRLVAKVAGFGLVAKVGLGASVAAASVAGAGAAGVLPEGANDAVRHAIEAVSPVQFEGDSTGERPSTTSAPGSPETTDATEAPEATDTTGTGAGTGSTIAGGPSSADHRPGSSAVDEPPGQSGDTGLTRANETPAAPHAPDTTPTTRPHPTPSSTTPTGPPGNPGQGSSGSAPSTVPAAYGDRAGDHGTDR